MNEKHWLTRAGPHKMLEFLGKQASERKLRLLTCACCRRGWHLFPDERVQRVIEAAEQFADGLLSTAELNAVRQAADACARVPALHGMTASGACVYYPTPTALGTAYLEHFAPVGVLYHTADCLTLGTPNKKAARDAETKAQADIVRDLFGNPYQPVPIDPAWLAWNNGLVVSLAQAAYDERRLPEGTLDNARLAILADALEEAGCREGRLLDHLRGKSPHYRGCFVLDAMAGRE
jgi:hypothetical protein